MKEDFNIWEGVYDAFSETPSCGEGFDSEQWLESSYKKILKDLNELDYNCTTKSSINFNTSPLFITSSMLYSETDTLRILDFGGGMGSSFIELISVLPQNSNILFTVVEGTKTCKKVNTLFEDDHRIKFKDKLPENKNYDIIHISTALQYIENWQSLLQELSKYNAKYFIFNNLNAGEIEKTYITIQNYYESKIPFIFFSIDDIIKEMDKNNYQLTFKANFSASIMGKYQMKPQNNFEKKYRIGYSKNMIFTSKHVFNDKSD